ncbi:MAG: hypothetical protein ABIN58_03755 [candidate division WOR-3 bacterium]
MRKGIVVSMLILTMAASALPALAGQSAGGRPIIGSEIILGGQSAGGRPVLGGGGFSTTGQIDPTGGGGEYQDPGFYSGGFYDGGGFPYAGYGYGFFDFVDWLFGDLFSIFRVGYFF